MVVGSVLALPVIAGEMHFGCDENGVAMIVEGCEVACVAKKFEPGGKFAGDTPSGREVRVTNAASAQEIARRSVDVAVNGDERSKYPICVVQRKDCVAKHFANEVRVVDDWGIDLDYVTLHGNPRWTFEWLWTLTRSAPQATGKGTLSLVTYIRLLTATVDLRNP